MVDMVVARVIDQRRTRIGRFEHVVGHPGVIDRQRAGPMLELDHPLQMPITSLRVLPRVNRKAGNLEYVHAGEPRRRVGGEDALSRGP